MPKAAVKDEAAAELLPLMLVDAEVPLTKKALPDKATSPTDLAAPPSAAMAHGHVELMTGNAEPNSLKVHSLAEAKAFARALGASTARSSSSSPWRQLSARLAARARWSSSSFAEVSASEAARARSRSTSSVEKTTPACRHLR